MLNIFIVIAFIATVLFFLLDLDSPDLNKRDKEFKPKDNAPDSDSSLHPESQPTIEWDSYEGNMFMSRAEKQEYMVSEDWVNLKAMRMFLAEHKCEVEGCECTTNLHLHHVDYIMLGTGSRELPYVRIVCGFHHQLVHDKLGYDRTTKFPLECLK